MSQREVEYRVIERFGVFSNNADPRSHVTKEVNLVEWGDSGVMLDIRKWKDGEPAKGITIRPEELDAFFVALKRAYPERF